MKTCFVANDSSENIIEISDKCHLQPPVIHPAWFVNAPGEKNGPTECH